MSADSSASTFFSFEPAAVDEAAWRPLRDKFEQWGLKPLLAHFRFSGRYSDAHTTAFMDDLVSSDGFACAVGVPATTEGRRRAVFRPLECTATSMAFFDKLQDAGTVTEAGSIVPCMDETCDGVVVSDRLRAMFVHEESEDADVFNAEEKQEFLYHVLHRLAVGGAMCQFEDNWQPYLDAAKAVYKNLVTVFRSQRTGQLVVGSRVLQLTSVDGLTLFPADSPHSFCYVIVDPQRRQVSVWYNAFVPYW